MELIRGIHNLQARHYGCVLTIGNFDGVHRGHQALLAQLKQEGNGLGAPVMVMMFEPQPQEFFTPAQAPARLTRLRDKCRHLAAVGVDYVLCIRFDQTFSSYPADEFIKTWLIEKLGVRFLLVGDDFRFGLERHGDYTLLKQFGRQYGFEVINSESFCEGDRRISSTTVRLALQQADLARAEMLLGYPYSISGRVVHGDGMGKTFGFPTANLPLKRLVVPVSGVYVVEVYGLGTTVLPGVANIGTRPTMGGVRQQLEVHLLGTSMDLYGCHIDVVLRAKLRDEQCFDSLEALKQQISNDVMAARDFFGLTARTLF